MIWTSMIDEQIYWWYIIPGATIFLPFLLKMGIRIETVLLSVLIAFCIGFGTHMFFRAYHYIVVRFVPRKSILYLDFRLRKRLRRRDFKQWDTSRIFEYYLERTDGWELRRLRRFSALLNLLGCMIVACGFGFFSVMLTHLGFLMKYYVLFTIFSLFNFTVVWETLCDLEILVAKTNIDVMIVDIKKNKLI